MTSGDDKFPCQHARAEAYYNDFSQSEKYFDWSGSDIFIKHNGVHVATMPSAYEVFEYCFEMDDIDVINDKFQLQSTSDDGVCITSLLINNNQLLVGKHNNLQGFWIDGNDNYCLDNFMSTSQITIQNGQVISSLCIKLITSTSKSRARNILARKIRGVFSYKTKSV